MNIQEKYISWCQQANWWNHMLFRLQNLHIGVDEWSLLYHPVQHSTSFNWNDLIYSQSKLFTSHAFFDKRIWPKRIRSLPGSVKKPNVSCMEAVLLQYFPKHYRDPQRANDMNILVVNRPGRTDIKGLQFTTLPFHVCAFLSVSQTTAELAEW